jgi:ATPase subunit of ABC transporter with duplicated ATPase domains
VTPRSVLEDLDTVVTIDEEICEHDCPLHNDLEFDHEAELNVHEEKWTDLACKDIEFHETAARTWQLDSEREDLHPDKRAFARGQMKNALKGAQRIRAELRRVLAGDPLSYDGPFVDLWAR